MRLILGIFLGFLPLALGETGIFQDYFVSKNLYVLFKTRAACSAALSDRVLLLVRYINS